MPNLFMGLERENPLHKFAVVKGECDTYCCRSDVCPDPVKNGEFKCVPRYEAVRAAVFRRLGIEV
jgi:hypothetical protein